MWGGGGGKEKEPSNETTHPLQSSLWQQPLASFREFTGTGLTQPLIAPVRASKNGKQKTQSGELLMFQPWFLLNSYG